MSGLKSPRRAAWSRLVLLGGLCAGVLAGSAADLLAACANPIRPPLTYDRVNWAELENLVADRGANSVIQQVQRLREDGQGQLNTDYYAITVDGNGEQAAQLFETLRADLNGFIFDGTSYSLSPYDGANAAKWNSGQPRGAVMSFVLAGIPGVDFERGSVVVSCFSATDLVFSTVTTEKDGVHPVAGNRAFGVFGNSDGSLTIFTKAADRVIDRVPYSSFEGVLFGLGHDVWMRFIANIKTKLRSRNPRGEDIHSVRVNY